MNKKIIIAVIIAILGGIFYFNRDIKPMSVTEKDIPKLPVIGKAPEIQGILGWINSDPISFEKLKGKVVLVDFWTYSCINCIRTLPYVQGWYEKYKDNGFVLLGVHAPEFDFEKNQKNVESAVQKYGLTYPVALDSDHKTWNTFANRYWPAHYLIDVEGNIRYQHFGEGRYIETEKAIQSLLLEAGLLTIDKIAEVAEPPTAVGADFSGIGTPEIYLGYLRINNVGNMDENVPAGKSFTFKMPEIIEKNKFYYSGTWRVDPEFSQYIGNPPSAHSGGGGGEEGKISIQYKASKLNMVLSAEGNEVEAEIKVDGKYLDESNKGADIEIVNGVSKVRVMESRLYNLIDTKSSYDWHILELIPKNPGFRAFTFTFG